MKDLKPKIMLRLIIAFESSANDQFSRAGQPLVGLPWRQFSQLLGGVESSVIDRMLCTTGYAGTYETYLGDELVEVQLEDDLSSNGVGYVCPQTFRWQSVPIEETAVIQVKEGVFLNYISDLMDIPEADRSGIDNPLVQGVLWKLGTASLTKGLRVPTYILRSVGRNLEVVIKALFEEKSPALVLSTSDILPQHISWPDGVSICSLSGAVPGHLASVSLDKEWLYQNIVQGGTQISENSRHLPVSYDSFRHALTIQGKSSWHITGPKQQKAVQYMVKQAENNRWELAAKEILDATKENGQVGGARTMDSLFSSSLEWQDYIKKIKRGIYALKLD